MLPHFLCHGANIAKYTCHLGDKEKMTWALFPLCLILPALNAILESSTEELFCVLESTQEFVGSITSSIRLGNVFAASVFLNSALEWSGGGHKNQPHLKL